MSNIPTTTLSSYVSPISASRLWTYLFAASMLAMCVGCWEEVHYEPTQASLPESQAPAPEKLQESEVEVDVNEEEENEEPASEPRTDDLPSQPTAPTEPEQDNATISSAESDEPITISPAENEQQGLDEQLPDEQPEATAGDFDMEEKLTLPEIPADKETAPVALPDETDLEKSTETTAEPTSPRNEIAVWKMSSKWSLAAAYFAKGIDAEHYDDLLEQANYAAKLIDVDLPDFSSLNNEEKRQAMVASYLIDGTGSRLVEAIAKSEARDHTALADLAIKTHALLLVYTPLNQDLDKIIVAIRASAEKSTVPENIWLPMVELLEQRASFAEVKQAVFQLHEQTSAHLSGLIAE